MRIVLTFCALLAAVAVTRATVHVVTNSGFNFSPNTITISLGDTVQFVVASIHNAREVSQSTWNANGSASDGGFETPFGGGDVILTSPGTYYYVCANHFSMGMKGTITVSPATGVEEARPAVPEAFRLLQNFPNPFNPTTSVELALPTRSAVCISVFSVTGQLVDRLYEGDIDAGYRTFTWDGSAFASGVYICRAEMLPLNGMKTPFSDAIRMILMR